jgi:outer membrane protein assembly factor BamE (lipoprotein component of BamABCDE complex)
MMIRSRRHSKTGKRWIASENIMTNKFLWLTGVALCCFAASTAYYASDKSNLGQVWGATPDDSGYNHDYSDATLAKVIPGQTTKAQVENLLGQPWRTTNFAEIGEDEPGHEQPEVWEWRGRDSQNGLYRVHIEFNPQGIVTNVAKVPEKTGMAPARVAPEEAPKGQPPSPQVTDDPSAGMFRHQIPVQLH